MKILYVFMGIGCEYVLQPLANFLKNRGYDCLEIDLMSSHFKISDWENLAKYNIVYITSAHLDKGKERAALGGNDFLVNHIPSEIIAPLELLDILKPIKSIYIPHDLTTPLGLHEWKFIDQFDLLFNPISCFSIYSNLVKTEEMGWIKYLPTIKTLPDNFIPRKKIIFVSMFDYLQAIYGIEGLFEYFSPLLDENTAIKFPLWNNHKEVETYFRNQRPEIQICEAHWNSVELIQHFDVVIVNHLSSVLMEASFLSKKVICLESDIACPQPHYQRNTLGFLPNIQFYPYHDAKVTVPLDSFIAENNFTPLTPEEKLKPFDFEKAMRLIVEQDTVIQSILE